MLQAAISGIASGAAYALLAVCLIVAYRTTGVLNLPAAAVGTWGTFLATVLHDHGWPWIAAAGVGVVAGALIATIAGLVIVRWFLEVSLAWRTTVSIAMLLLLFALSNRVFGSNARNIPELVAGGFSVGGVVVAWETVVILAVLIGIAASLSVVMARSRLGLVLQALTDRPRTTELLGIPAGGYVVGVWMTTGALAAIAMLLIAPRYSSDFGTLAFLVVPGMAAALCGALRNVWLAAVGGIALGMLEGVVTQIGGISNFEPVMPLVVILAVLVYTQRGEVWDEAR